MKFQQLKIGQEFEYQGDFYVKSSPLVAHHVEVALGPFLPLNFQTDSFRQSTVNARDRTSFLLMELERILPALREPEGAGKRK